MHSGNSHFEAFGKSRRGLLPALLENENRCVYCFTPCTHSSSLLEAFAEAVRIIAFGGAVWLSPARSSTDQIRPEQHRGELLCPPNRSTPRGSRKEDPNIHGALAFIYALKPNGGSTFQPFASRFSEEKTRSKNPLSKAAPPNPCHVFPLI